MRNRNLFILGLTSLLISCVFTSNAFCQNAGWNPIPHLVPTMVTLFDAAHVRNDNYVVVGDEGTILRSVDGGLTWLKVESGTADPLHHLMMCSSGVGIVVSDSGACLRTSDAGLTWTEFALEGEGFYAVERITDSILLIGGWKGLWRSEDAGLLWSHIPIDLGTFTAIARLNDSTAYAITAVGSAFRTTDGGRSWSKSGSAGAANAIEFYGDSVGFLVGNEGLFARTNDGGKEWKKLPKPANSEVRDVILISEKHTIAVHTVHDLIYTTDGGETFENKAFGSGNVRFTAIAMSDSLQGIIVGGMGEIYTTSDAYRTLRAAQQPPCTANFIAIDFGAPTSGVCSSGEAVLFTSDGGLTWNFPDSVDGVAWNQVDQQQVANRVTIEFIDDSTALVPWGSNRLGRSTNGGRTWNTIPVDDLYPIMHFLDHKHGIGVSDTHSSRTTDGGLTWQRMADFDSIPAEMIGAYYLALDNIICVDALGRVFNSNDSGKTWVDRGSALHGAGSFHDLAFTSATHGLISTSYGLYFSVDGGRTWTYNQATRNVFAYRMAFCDSTHGIAFTGYTGLTPNNLVYKTSDGGHTWSSIELNLAMMQQAIALTRDRVGFIVGLFGAIAYWKDDAFVTVHPSDHSDVQPPTASIKSLDPTPENDIVNVRFCIGEAGRFNLTTYHLDGTLYSSLDVGFFDIGEHEYCLNLGSTASGLIFVVPTLNGVAGPASSCFIVE